MQRSIVRCAGEGFRDLPASRREPVVRYEWPCPGDLLHIDTTRFQRFTRPGHADGIDAR
jgi:hypothetical protein